MNISNHTNAAQIATPNIFESLSEDLINENSYGLEYIIDEIFTVKNNNAAKSQAIDWFGLMDLTI